MTDNTPTPEPRAPSLTVQGYAVPAGGYVPRRIVGIQHLAQWKNDPAHAAAWLCKLVGSAFQTFVIMALPGQPAAEMLPLTAQLWVDVLGDMNVNEDQDLTRIETAIRQLTRKLKEWPQIADLIAAMPNREQTATASDHRATTVVSAAGQAAGLEALATLKKEMGI